MRAVTVAAHNNNDPLLVLLTAFELPSCKGVVCLSFANASTLDNKNLKDLRFKI